MSWTTRHTGLGGNAPRSDGGQDFLAGIYRRHAKTVYRLCYSFLGNASDAEDATQNVFMKLVDNPRQFSSAEHEKAWLIVCAQNHCRDVLRSAYRARTAMEADGMDRVPAPDSDESDLREAIFRLPDKYKTCVYLYYYEGYRSKEIAQMIGVPDSTVRSYLSEARHLLKDALGGDRR